MEVEQGIFCIPHVSMRRCDRECILTVLSLLCLQKESGR